MPYGDGGTRLGYQDHYVVDGGRARIILTALVAPAEVQENQPALDLLWRARFRWKLRPRQVTGRHQVRHRREHRRHRGAAASAPTSRCPRSASRPGRSASTDFVYDAAADTYRCPGARRLRFLSQCETHAAARLRGASRQPAPPARSGAQCTTRSAAGAWGAVSTRPIWSGCAATTRRSPTPRRCANARSGSSRCSPKPRTGTACGASACGAGEGQRRGAADRGRAEPEAPAQPAGLGPAPVPERGRRRGAPGDAAGCRPPG